MDPGGSGPAIDEGGEVPDEPNERDRRDKRNNGVDVPEWPNKGYDGPNDPSPPANENNGEKNTRDLATLARAAVQAFAFPLLLALLVIFYLSIQYWLDRKDPKLAVAPVHAKHDLARFV